MEPTLAANGPALLPMIWSPEFGFHFDALFNYVLFFAILGKSLYRLVDTVFDFLRKMVNKIQIPAWGIDFSKYYWDDAIIEYLRAFAKTQVAAKQAEAKKIKLQYDDKIVDAPDRVTALELHEKCRGELESLTKLSVSDLKIFDPILWKSILAKCKDEQEATQFVTTHVKAEVMERKNGSSADVSLTRAVKEKKSENGTAGFKAE